MVKEKVNLLSAEKKNLKSWAQKCTSITLVLRRVRQQDPRMEGQFGLHRETLSEEKEEQGGGKRERWGKERGERKGIG